MLGVLLGGSWVVISGGISPQMWVIFIVALLITPLIATLEPPSKALQVLSEPGSLSREALHMAFSTWPLSVVLD